MLSQNDLHNRRQFLERSMLGFGSALFLPSLLASCTDHIIDPSVTPVQPVGGSVSKGIDYYAYLGNSNFSVQFQKPTDHGKSTQTVQWPTQGAMINQMLGSNFQIAESDLKSNEHTGRFQWHLFNSSVEISAGYAEIAPSTGNLGKSSIGVMMNTFSTTFGDYSISYGFYDAGSGVGSLTNQDQFYIYATANHSNWMGNLANGNSSVKNAPLNRFVLPGAHDAGMFDLNSVKTLTSHNGFLSATAAAVGCALQELNSLGPQELLNVVINLAFTQKDSIIPMLNLGIRYFDFRPGYSFDDATQSYGLYHQHNFIPGYSFNAFMQDICQWLQKNPSEIVVVCLGHSGFNETYMKAGLGTLWQIINDQVTASNIGLGNKLDLTTSYSDLVQANKRLIVLAQYGFKTDPSDPISDIPILDAVKYDSYSDKYQTTDIRVIMDALNGMDPSEQSNSDYTVLQFQGTASGASGGGFDSVTSVSATASPLMSTKAHFDQSTYPWLLANGSRFSKDQLLVCLNDFADNALTDSCIAVTEQRAG